MFQVSDIPVMNRALDILRTRLANELKRADELRAAVAREQPWQTRRNFKRSLVLLKLQINSTKASIAIMETPPKR